MISAPISRESLIRSDLLLHKIWIISINKTSSELTSCMTTSEDNAMSSELGADCCGSLVIFINSSRSSADERLSLFSNDKFSLGTQLPVVAAAALFSRCSMRSSRQTFGWKQGEKCKSLVLSVMDKLLIASGRVWWPKYSGFLL